MPSKNIQLKKKKLPDEYLELHIDENGTINFLNLSKNSIALFEEISGKKQDHRDFYCG
jgi:hypothetical protein